MSDIRCPSGRPPNAPAIDDWPAGATFRHRLVTLFAVVVCLVSCGARPDPAQTPRPNVVVILVDDARWDDFGFAGHPFVQTPAVDRLAREGTRFLNAFATTPLCSPSRAALLTGQYVHTNGIIDNTARDAASHRLPTFAVSLSAAGYRTGFFGKWHMGNDDTRRPGWTSWVAMKGQGEAIDPQLNVDGERITKPGTSQTCSPTTSSTSCGASPASRSWRCSRTRRCIPTSLSATTDRSPRCRTSARGLCRPNVIAAATRRRLSRAGRMRGWLRKANRPCCDQSPSCRPSVQKRARRTRTCAIGWRCCSASTRASRGSSTRCAGLGALDNTVIIFTSDHGYFYGEHGLNEERRLAYEETARIPLVVRYPRVARAGATPSELVQIIDLAPTVLALTGVADSVPRQGRSLVPLLEGASVPWRSSILLEYYTDTVFPRMLTMGYQAVRTERHKYIQYLELSGMDELYDLQADPFEMNNLLSTEEGRRLLPDLRAELERLQRESGYRADFRGYR